jgi:hypothetical protein
MKEILKKINEIILSGLNMSSFRPDRPVFYDKLPEQFLIQYFVEAPQQEYCPDKIP